MASKRKDWSSLPASEKQLQEWFLKGKRHPAMKMADTAIKMERSPNQAFILLVGLSGAGKSSTINYMFESNVAKTSAGSSETDSTTEYRVSLKSTEWKIEDLFLSIIDTPGLCDTDGLLQDAKNIMSVKNFLKTHRNMRRSFPNLVMIILSSMDTRIEGESSNFAKMLKGISTINAIDQNNPNVVVVLTHIMALAHNPTVWMQKVEMKKAQVRAIVRVFLGVDAEIVVQENEPIENDLKRDGDWYLLPNGDKQPKILYQACENVLNRAKDEIGHEAVAVYFRPGKDKEVSKRYSTSSKTVSMEDANDMHSILLESIVRVSKSEVGKMLENYKKNTTLKELQNEVLILQVRFRDLGLSNTNDLQSMTMNSLMARMYPTRMTKAMQTIVQKVFGVSFEQSTDFDYHVGKGFNLFTDSATQFSPLVMKLDSKIQYGLPANVSLKDCSSLEIRCDSIQSTNEYVAKRLRELKVGMGSDINYGAFNLQPRSGYNARDLNNTSFSGKFEKSSFSVEHRIKKMEIQQPYKISEEFKTDVKALPSKYDMKDEQTVLKWKAFFNKWGMYVVTGAFIGGSLSGEVKLVQDELTSSTIEDAETALALKMSFLQRSSDFDYSDEKEKNTITKNVSTVHSTFLKWTGGKNTECKASLENIEQKEWMTWIQSLEYSPVPLWSSLDLYPLYHLASEVSQEKGTTMQMAMNLALKGRSTNEEPTEDNRDSTAASNESGSCFHEDSVVMLGNRKQKRMKDLAVGDTILIANSNGTVSQDEVIAWLHQVKDGQFTFLQIVHDHGKITLTPEHIIFVGKSQTPQHASTLKPGDQVSFCTIDENCQTLTMSIVLSIHQVEGRGIYAPLTYSGRLLVDKIDVSCYCTLNPLKVLGKDIISSHALAHAGFLPLRMAFKLGLNISSSKLNDETGIHGYAQWLMSVILGK